MHLIAHLCLFAFASTLAYSAESRVSGFLKPISLRGEIYPSGNSNSPALFTFHRTAELKGSNVLAWREYFSTDGQLAAKETVEYQDGALKRFALDELQIHARGSATFEKAQDGETLIRFEYQTANRKKESTEIQSGPVLVNDMLPGFISSHWSGLTNGQTFNFRYAIVPRLETIAFTLQKTAERKIGQISITEIEMRPANWFLAKLVEPIVFSVETNPPHRIRQYTGRTTPKIRRGNTWDDLDALTTFFW